MHFRYFRDLGAFRLMAFTRDAFFSHEVSGGLRSFTFGGVGSAGRVVFVLLEAVCLVCVVVFSCRS
jgi:hypothetical protein